MLPCVMFTFSIAPLTTAWTPGRCGFIGCITRTRANGEKVHVCSGGSSCGLAGWGEADLRVQAGSVSSWWRRSCFSLLPGKEPSPRKEGLFW